MDNLEHFFGRRAPTVTDRARGRGAGGLKLGDQLAEQRLIAASCEDLREPPPPPRRGTQPPIPMDSTHQGVANVVLKHQPRRIRGAVAP